MRECKSRRGTAPKQPRQKNMYPYHRTQKVKEDVLAKATDRQPVQHQRDEHVDPQVQHKVHKQVTPAHEASPPRRDIKVGVPDDDGGQLPRLPAPPLAQQREQAVREVPVAVTGVEVEARHKDRSGRAPAHVAVLDQHLVPVERHGLNGHLRGVQGHPPLRGVEGEGGDRAGDEVAAAEPLQVVPPEMQEGFRRSPEHGQYAPVKDVAEDANLGADNFPLRQRFPDGRVHG